MMTTAAAVHEEENYKPHLSSLHVFDTQNIDIGWSITLIRL